jgi:hypothetical protein
MRPVPCVLSVTEHTGWAHLVCVAAHGNVPAVIARRRVALIDQGLPTMPYEHDTTAMREEEANAVIARVRRSIAARTSEALRRVAIELAPAHTAVALAIREPPFIERWMAGVCFFDMIIFLRSELRAHPFRLTL